MPDSNNGRHSRNVFVYDPQKATTKKLEQITTSAHLDDKTLRSTRKDPLLNDDATVQVQVRIPMSDNAKPAALLDDASTTVIDRRQLFAEAVRLDKATRLTHSVLDKTLECTIKDTLFGDFLTDDNRATVATPAISEKTIADQDVVQVGSWREFIVEVDDQLCLIVPIEIARSGLLKPGRRLVARIRTLDE